MKKLLACSIPMAMLAIAGCVENTDRPTSAVGRQTKVLREQNAILERIAVSLEKMADAKGETKCRGR